MAMQYDRQVINGPCQIHAQILQLSELPVPGATTVLECWDIRSEIDKSFIVTELQLVTALVEH